VTATCPALGIELEVALGIGTIEPGGVWDEGEWDLNTWQQPDTSMGDWTDVTDRTVSPISTGAGSSADGVVTRWEAATCALDLIGAQWDPRSGPYARLLGPGLPVRVRWRPIGDTEWLVAFIGAADDDGFSYDPKTQRAHVAATDGTRIFAGFDGIEQPPTGAGDTAGQRVVRIADMVGWPDDRRDIDPGGVALKATTLADAAWTMLLAVADTDLALLWVNRAGSLAFRSQAKTRPSSTIIATVGCAPGDIAPVNIVDQQSTQLRNIVSVSREALDDSDSAVTVTVRDEPSVARFLAHSYERTDLQHTDDAWTPIVADAILQNFAWPSTAPAQVELSSRADPAATALLLGLEPSQSIFVDDGGGRWQCEPAGWSVTIGRSEVSGSIDLLDVTMWAGSSWDDGTWDDGVWGF
jgi:hypothetical protein